MRAPEADRPPTICRIGAAERISVRPAWIFANPWGRSQDVVCRADCRLGKYDRMPPVGKSAARAARRRRTPTTVARTPSMGSTIVSAPMGLRIRRSQFPRRYSPTAASTPGPSISSRRMTSIRPSCSICSARNVLTGMAQPTRPYGPAAPPPAAACAPASGILARTTTAFALGSYGQALGRR